MNNYTVFTVADYEDMIPVKVLVALLQHDSVPFMVTARVNDKIFIFADNWEQCLWDVSHLRSRFNKPIEVMVTSLCRAASE